MAGSQALRVDALDFLADATTYGISLAAVGASMRVRSAAPILKGTSLTLMASWVLGTTAYHVFVTEAPKAEVMGAIGILALLANLASVLILVRYKDGDANVRSVWLCSRNDAIGNIAVNGLVRAHEPENPFGSPCSPARTRPPPLPRCRAPGAGGGSHGAAGPVPPARR
jgi:Co/Zn/Cd efflux system component